MSSPPIQLKVPAVGESVSEVAIAEWLKAEGDPVRRDENVLVLETDKATLEVPSPVTGRLTRILKQKGDKAAVGELLGEIEAGDPGSPERTSKAPPKPGADSAGAESTLPPPTPVPMPTPAVPSEPIRLDVQSAPPLPERPAPERPAPPPRRPDPAPSKAAVTARSDSVTERAEEVVPMSLLRRKIAERLVAAQHTAALLTTFNEVDMGALLALRKESQERFTERHQVKLGLMSFFIKATVLALGEVPQLNAELRENNIVYRKYHDVAVAIGGGRGLVVPVLRDAGRKSFAELERAIADFARRVKDNTIKPDELQGGSFTITNGGVYGSLLSTPLVNPPQSGVLGMHAIQDRPVAVAGQVVIRPMMYIALTYDHRLVDGREAVQFLRRIKELIESPARMLIEI